MGPDETAPRCWTLRAFRESRLFGISDATVYVDTLSAALLLHGRGLRAPPVALVERGPGPWAPRCRDTGAADSLWQQRQQNQPVRFAPLYLFTSASFILMLARRLEAASSFANTLPLS